MGTIIVALILAAVVALAVRSMIRDKKKGKSLQCGGNCSSCGHCPHSS
ncbi:MAG: FeoB-associated Cys-rich membrane protein [Candidatus Gastranaerophilales bacterium]|nr:FeoB-associated Cys-rich membrane protein [Candidatus Gastranaerophilales bacterium]